MERIGPQGPTQVGPFRVIAVLGQGGMGRVLLGAGPDGRLVAVKQVLAHFADDDGFRARFRREVAASRKAPGVYTAAVMDADPDAPTPWLASVFVAGPSLGAAVEAAGALPEATVRRIAAGLATALLEIHRVGLVHRDLKPDNVLLAEDGVRVIDFGIARAAERTGDTGLTQTGMVIGSPAFMSPEQAQGREPTPAADVFSLGSVLVMALTGASPFAGPSLVQTLFNVVHAEPDLTGVPQGLRPVVERCLAKDPADRPSPARLLELLGPVAAAGRQWPPAVYRMLAAQQADIDRLLGDPDRTAAAVPGPPAVMPAPGPPDAVSLPPPGVTPVPPADVAPVAPAAAVPGAERTAVAPEPAATWAAYARSRRAPGRVAALVVAGVLGVAGIGAGAYALRPEGGAGASGRTEDMGKYAGLEPCAEAVTKLSLPRRDAESDRHTAGPGSAQTTCVWTESTRPGASPSVLLQWDVQLGEGGARNATAAQRENFRQEAGRTMREAGLGFGDEAYRGNPGFAGVCALVVRDGNLIVRVSLGGSTHPAATCDQDARKIAKAAVEAVPR